jgi:lysophospholipase L1-like esterase
MAIGERGPTDTNNRDEITEPAERLGQESAMHLFVFACLVLALMAQGVEGQTDSSEQDYASDAAQNNKVFRIVIIGDSIAWGAGLENDLKYYSLVRDWIASERSIPIESIDMQVLAHTGAMLFTENDDPIRLSDLSSGNPMIAQQADMISNPSNVDLILVSGGINDVGVDNIIKLDHLENPTDI